MRNIKFSKDLHDCSFLELAKNGINFHVVSRVLSLSTKSEVELRKEINGANLREAYEEWLLELNVAKGNL